MKVLFCLVGIVLVLMGVTVAWFSVPGTDIRQTADGVRFVISGNHPDYVGLFIGLALSTIGIWSASNRNTHTAQPTSKAN